MQDNFGIITMLFTLIIIVIIIGVRINNKIYDIREIQNGTCIHENNYNGICRAQ